MPAAADLHLHTTCSDGQLAPAALVRKAAERGLSTLAITDHDTIAGLAEAQQAGRACGVQVVTGVELSVTVSSGNASGNANGNANGSAGGAGAQDPRDGGEEIHLLGYRFDPAHEGLRRHLARFAEVRRERARKMAARLTELGHPLTLADVQAQAADGAALGRPHVAQALVAAGHAPGTRVAFDRLIGDEGPAFVQKPRFDAADALALLHDAGGIGALAHPGEWTSTRTFRTLLAAGLDAVEVVHPSHDDRLTRYWRRQAEAQDLRQTGGSDYHGHRAGEDEHLGRYTAPNGSSIFD